MVVESLNSMFLWLALKLKGNNKAIFSPKIFSLFSNCKISSLIMNSKHNLQYKEFISPAKSA